jgi:hypothetical protein
MNQSVIVFADAAARTTAIPTPIQGMLTYLVDTAAYESWNGSAYVGLGSPITTEGDLITGDASGDASRIGIGTAAQVLTVVAGAPAWADGGGSSTEWSQILNASIPTGSSTASVSFSSGYDKYRIYLNNLQASTTATYKISLQDSIGTKFAYSTGNFVNMYQAFQAKEAGIVSSSPDLQIYTNTSSPGQGICEISGASQSGQMYASIRFAANSNTSDAQLRFNNLHYTIPSGKNLARVGFETTAGTFVGGTITIFGA